MLLVVGPDGDFFKPIVLILNMMVSDSSPVHTLSFLSACWTPLSPLQIGSPYQLQCIYDALHHFKNGKCEGAFAFESSCQLQHGVEGNGSCCWLEYVFLDHNSRSC